MDRDGKWGSMMSCLESVKEYAQELSESNDITADDFDYIERGIDLVEDTTRDIMRRWEAEEARLVKANTFSVDLRYESLDMLRLLCDNTGVEHGTREEMIARLLE